RVVRKRLGEEDAGVIDQYVDGPEARERCLEGSGGGRLIADMAVHEGDAVRSRHFSGLGHLPGIGNDVEAALDKRFHNSCADALRSSSHDGCLSLAAHDWLPSTMSLQLDPKTASGKMG